MQTGQRVFVTGSSGFVGSAVVKELLDKGFGVNALVRGGNSPMDGVTAIAGDLFDLAALDGGMAGCDAVIHLVGIIAEKPSAGVTFERIHDQGTQAVVEAARRSGVTRYIHMSAMGSRPGAPSRYHQTKYAAERYVMGSGLDWTIFRPSMIHGPGGEFMRMEARMARKKAAPWLFMPYFGRGLLGTGGAGKLQPVFVGDVARAFVEAIGNPKAIGEVYPLAGSEVVTWPELHRIVALAVVGKRRWVMAIPAWKAKLLTRIVPGFLLPFNRDQVIMSGEDNVGEVAKFERDFEWRPVGISEAIGGYAKEL